MRRTSSLLLGIVWLAVAVSYEPVRPNEIRLVPRADLLQQAQTLNPRLSPSGGWVSYEVPGPFLTDRLRFVPTNNPSATPLHVTSGRRADLTNYVWLSESQLLVYTPDPDHPPELLNVGRTGVSSNDIHVYLPWPGDATRLLSVVREDDEHFVARFATDVRSQEAAHNVFFRYRYRVSGTTIEYESWNEVTEGRGWDLHWDHHTLVAATRPRNPGTEVRLFGSDRTLQTDIAPGNIFKFTATAFLAFRDAPNETLGIERFDAELGQWQVVARDAHFDIENVVFSRSQVVGYAVESATRVWRALDPNSTWQARFARHRMYLGDEVRIHYLDASSDESFLVLCADSPREPLRCYLDVRGGDHLIELPARDPNPGTPSNAASSQSARVLARDGLSLPIRYFVPRDSDPDQDGIPGPFPTVVWIHGGPHNRVSLGYDPELRLLANRGYLVLAPDFRGSTGYGESFRSSGRGQWHDLVQTDLDDVVNWAVDRRLADPTRIAAWGSSFGGYATLMALSRQSPFRCGVSTHGPVDLRHLDHPWMGYSTDEERFRASPLARASALRGPLLIAHGADDGIVTLNQARDLTAQLAPEVDITQVILPHSGHGFSSADTPGFWALAERLLARCLGGQAEPIHETERDAIASFIPLTVGSTFDELFDADPWRLLPLPHQSIRLRPTITEIAPDRFLLIGGDFPSTAEVLDLSAGRADWQRSAPPPTSRSQHFAAGGNGRVFVVGGVDARGTPLQSAEHFDASTNLWSSLPSLPHNERENNIVASLVLASGPFVVVSKEWGGDDCILRSLRQGSRRWREDGLVMCTSSGRVFGGFAVPWGDSAILVVDEEDRVETLWPLREGRVFQEHRNGTHYEIAVGLPDAERWDTERWARVELPDDGQHIAFPLELRDGRIVLAMGDKRLLISTPFDPESPTTLIWQDLPRLPPPWEGAISLFEVSDGRLLAVMERPFVAGALLSLPRDNPFHDTTPFIRPSGASSRSMAERRHREQRTN